MDRKVTLKRTLRDPRHPQLPNLKPVKRICRTTGHKIRVALVTTGRRRKTSHKPLRHIEDPVTSIVALLVWVALGFLGLLVLMLTLAIGS